MAKLCHAPEELAWARVAVSQRACLADIKLMGWAKSFQVFPRSPWQTFSKVLVEELSHMPMPSCRQCWERPLLQQTPGCPLSIKSSFPEHSHLESSDWLCQLCPRRCGPHLAGIWLNKESQVASLLWLDDSSILLLPCVGYSSRLEGNRRGPYFIELTVVVEDRQ